MSQSTSKGQRALPPESRGAWTSLRSTSSSVCVIFSLRTLFSSYHSIYLKLGKQVRVGKNAVNSSNIHTNNADVHMVLCGRQSTFL